LIGLAARDGLADKARDILCASTATKILELQIAGLLCSQTAVCPFDFLFPVQRAGTFACIFIVALSFAQGGRLDLKGKSTYMLQEALLRQIKKASSQLPACSHSSINLVSPYSRTLFCSRVTMTRQGSSLMFSAS
jgi:hypothetical protein